MQQYIFAQTVSPGYVFFSLWSSNHCDHHCCLKPSPSLRILLLSCWIMQTCTAWCKVLHWSIKQMPVVIRRQELVQCGGTGEKDTVCLLYYLSHISTRSPWEYWPCLLYTQPSSIVHIELLNSKAVTSRVGNLTHSEVTHSFDRWANRTIGLEIWLMGRYCTHILFSQKRSEFWKKANQWGMYKSLVKSKHKKKTQASFC